MKRQAMMFAAVGAALVLGAGAVHADEQQQTQTTARRQAGKEAGAKEITGRVLQASPSKLFLEHMGAVVEFTISSDAEFSGGNVRSSQEFSGGNVRSSQDLSEGQEVRASFTVENKTINVAKRISLASEAGAAVPHGGTGSAGETQPGSGTMGATPSEPAPQERVPGTPPSERTPSDPGTATPRDPGLTPPPKR